MKTSGGRPALDAGFDFTSNMRRLVADVTCRLPELRHVDFSRVAVSFSQARTRSSYGIYASLTPMRFEGGSLFGVRRRRKYTVQRLYDAAGLEMLYILTFYLPRFMDVPFQEKLTTILHELWHISPAFDGDIRRHPGRCYVHTGSQKEYDAAMAELARQWLDLSPPEELYGFLRHDFRQLKDRHGGCSAAGFAIRNSFRVRVESLAPPRVRFSNLPAFKSGRLYRQARKPAPRKVALSK